LYDTAITSIVGTFSSVVNGMNWVFTPSNLQGGSYHWEFGDGSSSNATIGVHQYSSSGAYPVTLTIDGCSTTNPILTFDASQGPLGQVLVFPNPSDGHIHLFGSDLGNGAISIEVTTMMGQVLFSESQKLIGGVLDTEIEPLVAPGIYLLRMRKGDVASVRKVVVVR
jgi:hypothetical protein